MPQLKLICFLEASANNNLLEQIKATYHSICYEYDKKIEKKDSSFGLIPKDYQIVTLDNLIEKNTEKVKNNNFVTRQS